MKDVSFPVCEFCLVFFKGFVTTLVSRYAPGPFKALISFLDK